MTERLSLPRRQLIAVGVGVAAVLSGIVAGGWELQDAITAQRDRIKDLEAGLAVEVDATEAVSDGLDVTRQQLEAEGVEPVVPPAEEIVDDVERGRRGEQGEQGEPGKRGRRGPGPTDAQVAAAVDRWCRINGCVGEPTAAQVATALVTYCDARGECRGVAGEDGEDGTDGTDGVDGAPGPPPSDEQIAELIAAYCDARNGCRGATGPAGKDGEDSTVPGPQGEPGPTCPDGANPIEWTVEQRHAAVTGLEPGDYLICRTGD